jgi:DNA-binding transcriptional regulator YdaS (Cro superfamily)
VSTNRVRQLIATGQLPATRVAALRDATGRELTRVPVRPDDIVGLDG